MPYRRNKFPDWSEELIAVALLASAVLYGAAVIVAVRLAFC